MDIGWWMMDAYFQLQQHHRLQGRLSEGNRDRTWFSFQIGIFFIQEPLVSLLILILSYSCLSTHNNLLHSGVGRRPGVDPLDGGERLLGGLRPLETGDGLSRGGKVTFIFRQKMSHSVWRDTWIAGYIDQVNILLYLKLYFAVLKISSFQWYMEQVNLGNFVLNVVLG